MKFIKITAALLVAFVFTACTAPQETASPSASSTVEATASAGASVEPTPEATASVQPTPEATTSASAAPTSQASASATVPADDPAPMPTPDPAWEVHFTGIVDKVYTFKDFDKLGKKIAQQPKDLTDMDKMMTTDPDLIDDADLDKFSGFEIAEILDSLGVTEYSKIIVKGNTNREVTKEEIDFFAYLITSLNGEPLEEGMGEYMFMIPLQAHDTYVGAVKEIEIVK